MNRLVIAMIGALGLAVWGAEGQSLNTSAELPPGPLLKGAPDDAHWLVRFAYPGSSTADASQSPASQALIPPRPTEVSVVKTKPLWHAVTSGRTGVLMDCWGDSGATYSMPSKAKDPAFEISRNQTTKQFDIPIPAAVGYDKRDFPDMEWISSSTYIGSLKDGAVLVFREKADGGATVYVDGKSRLPLRWQKVHEVRDFVFLPAPNERLVFPPQILAIIKAGETIYEASMWPPRKR
jgi:hypothetical protein